MVCEAMIDVEHLKELLCESCFWIKLVGHCVVLHLRAASIYVCCFQKNQREDPSLGTHRSLQSWTI